MTFVRHSVVSAMLLLVGLAPLLPLHAQQSGGAPAIAGLRIEVMGDKAGVAASGVLPLKWQGRGALLRVRALDAAGAPVAVGSAVPSWATSDPEVVSLHDRTESRLQVVAQQDGRATITVTLLGKSAALPVAVGAARHAVTAAEVTPSFRVARLTLSEQDPTLGAEKLAGRALLLATNVGVRVRARIHAADGRELSLSDEDFPVVWSTSDETVIAIHEHSANGAWLIGRGTGQSTVTATVQGVSVTLAGFVGVPRSQVNGAILAATPAAGPAPSGPPGTTSQPGSAAGAPASQPASATVSGAIRGTVTSPTRGALRDVVVSASSDLSDATGAFDIVSPLTGSRTVTVSNLPSGCTAPAPRIVDVSNGAQTVDFSVTCAPSPAPTTGANSPVQAGVTGGPQGGYALNAKWMQLASRYGPTQQVALLFTVSRTAGDPRQWPLAQLSFDVVYDGTILRYVPMASSPIVAGGMQVTASGGGTASARLRVIAWPKAGQSLSISAPFRMDFDVLTATNGMPAPVVTLNRADANGTLFITSLVVVGPVPIIPNLTPK